MSKMNQKLWAAEHEWGRLKRAGKWLQSWDTQLLILEKHTDVIALI